MRTTVVRVMNKKNSLRMRVITMTVGMMAMVVMIFMAATNIVMMVVVVMMMMMTTQISTIIKESFMN